MEVFFSAGDVSSEMHAASALAEMRKINPEISAWGLGGDRLQDQGASLIMHTKEFMVGGGPLEILSRLPQRSRLERLVEKRLLQKRPSGAILVDNGEVNLRLASLFHFFKVPVVYYIPPKVWAWRSSRLQAIHHHVSLVLSILPFEKEWYDAWEIPYKFVGNPLLDQVPTHLSVKEALAELSKSGATFQSDLNSDHKLVAALLGSRYSEIRFHIPLFAKVMSEFYGSLRRELPTREALPDLILPVATGLDINAIRDAFLSEFKLKEVRAHFVSGLSHAAMKASRVALIKSGTSTLECALLGTPFVVTYQTGRVARWIFHNIVRYDHHVALSNLILALGKKAVSEELILEKATPNGIAGALMKIYREGEERTRQIQSLTETHKLLMPPQELGKSPSEAVAGLVLELFSKGKV